MINSLNPVFVPRNIQNLNGDSVNKNISTPVGGNYLVQNPNLNGARALASYNTPVAAANPKVITPALPTVLQPEAIKGIKGERVLSSSGTLDSIISKNEKTTVVYKMDVQAPNDAISKIETYDNVTGKLISVQSNINLIEQGVMPQNIMTEIAEFNSENGQLKKITTYDKGKLDAVCEFEYAPNGDEKVYTVTNRVSTLNEKFANGDTGRITSFDKSGKITEVRNYNEATGQTEIITYKNGVPSKVENKSYNNAPIANTTGKNPQADTDLIPSEPYVLGYEPKSVQGNRTFYSNGMLETINTNTENGFVMHRFDINGELSGIVDARDPESVKTVLFAKRLDGEKYTSVEEEISEGVYKTTTFNSDGTKEVGVMNSNTKNDKHAFYLQNGVMEHYGEYNKDGSNLIMEFNKNGELINIL